MVYQRVVCPPCVPDYQNLMRGVDFGDQMMGYYRVGRRSKKWWKRGFWYILDVAALNSYVVYRHGNVDKNTRKRYLDFRIRLAVALIDGFTSRRSTEHSRQVVQTPQQLPLRLDPSQHHLPLYADAKKDCVVCSKARLEAGQSRSEVRHRSSIMCKVCDVYLCLDRERLCYEKYEVVMNL